MVRWFVAVHVVAENTVTRHVFSMRNSLVGQFHREERVQTLHEDLFAAHHLDQTGHIMRHVEAVIPGISLNEALVVGTEKVKLRFINAATETWTRPMDLRVKGVFKCL